MQDDLDVTPTPSEEGSGGLDPLYQSIYGGGTGEQVAPRQVGFPVVPPFTHYVLKPVRATRNRTDKNVGARVQVEIQEGPGDTAGFKFTDSGSIWFIVARTSTRKGQDVTLTQEEWEKKCDNRRRLLNRIRAALSLHFSAPQGSFSDAAVDAYCSQFGSGRPFIAEVRIEVGQDGVPRNRIVWESVAGFEEPVLDRKNQPTGKTAVDEAHEKITAQNARAQAKGGSAAPAGKTSGSLAPSDLG